MNEKSGLVNRIKNRGGRALLIALCGLAITAAAASAASAATIVLTNGAVVKGDYLSRTNTEVTIREETTKQIRSIKIENIRDMTLSQAERGAGGGKDLKLRGGSGLDFIKDGRRHFLVALGGAGAKIVDGPGKSLNFGFGGSFIFQYNYLWKGLGLDLHGSYYYNMDSKNPGDYITILPVLVSPMWVFNTKYIDIGLRVGAGISWSYGKSAQRFNFIPTGDPGQPLAAILAESLDNSSIDLAAGAGVSISHTFSMGVTLGFEANYYYIFQTLSANAVAASVYVGYMF